MNIRFWRSPAFAVLIGLVIHGGSRSLMADDATTAPAKLPLPTPSAFLTATKLVNQLYADDIAKATTPRQQSELAEKFLGTANEESGDIAGKYALYLRAKDLACDARNLSVAYNVIEDASNTFAINPLKLQGDTVLLFAKAPRSPAEGYGLITEALWISAAAEKADQLDLARRMGEAAISMAHQLGNHQVITDVIARVQELSEVISFSDNIAPLQAAVTHDPNNKDANAKLGEYTCLVKGDWDAGLPMLAKGSDPVLKNLAAMDLNAAGKELDVGDQWAVVAERLTGIQKRHALLRAKKWYLIAMPLTAGLSQEKIAKQLEKLSRVSDTKSGIDELTVVALIDGGSELHLTPDGIFAKEWGADKPGQLNGVNLPTYINEFPWMPEWGQPNLRHGNDISMPLPIKLGAMDFDFEVLAIAGDQKTRSPLTIAGMDQRDPVTMSSDTNEQILSIPDSQSGGRWYKVHLFRKSPATRGEK